ncbi:MAG TPA: hypothetical protein VJU84_14755 [Pyrinomonadaceae bacterium]|nr:hypothetical protein [Pyrinomonadaceae bacterium]
MKTESKRILRTSILGALNGAVYSAIMWLMIWAWMAVANRDHALETTSYGDFIQLGNNERWSGIVIAWLVAFTLASILVSGLWRSNRKRSILYWEIVGVVAMVAWNGFALIGSLLGKHYEGDTQSYAWVTSLNNPLFGPISFAVVIVVNFVYGYLVQFFQLKTHRRTT